MTILRVGTNAKYADGWSQAFGGKKASPSKPAAKATESKAKVTVKAAKKKAAPKKSAKKKKK